MTPLDALKLRFTNQRLQGSTLNRADQVVKWFGAIQSQDFRGAKWAIAQRMKNGTRKSIDAAFNDGTILRTHVMRPTWHLVANSDLRWLLKLTGERVRRALAANFRTYKIDDNTNQKVRRILEKFLQDRKYLTRTELKKLFARHSIDATDTVRMAHLLLAAEVDGIICSGPLRGRQFTYALLEERAKGKWLDRDESIAELTIRYFQSHGPATLKDFCWWSGLTAVDAKRGLDMNSKAMTSVTIGNHVYYFQPTTVESRRNTLKLLPMFDEYLVAYKSRRELLDLPWEEGAVIPGSSPIVKEALPIIARPFSTVGLPLPATWLGPAIVVAGQIVGGWKAKLVKKTLAIELELFRSLNRRQRSMLDAALRSFKDFAGDN